MIQAKQHIRNTAFFLFASMALTGCGYFADLSRVEPVTNDVTDEKSAYAVNIVPDDIAAGGKYADQSGRNILQSKILRHSDQACEDHKSYIHSNSAVFNVSADILTSTLAGAGAIVTGQTAANVLSGAAALTNSTRSSVNEEVYQELLTAAIIAEIDFNRSELLKTLEGKREKEVNQYTVYDAIRDAENYNRLCSFYSGVSSLVQKAGRTNRKPETSPSERIKLLRAERAEDQMIFDTVTELLNTEENKAVRNTDLIESLKEQQQKLQRKMTNIAARLDVLDDQL
ncbi:hypothetical protein [Kiloniella sp. b19]|uniref:hypothetical protein n=1 Tax=Kiloniella sp. GXU_MW_B19 TaxID=3141326 RepID=UPI0031DFECE9